MKKYVAQFARVFEVTVEAEDDKAAEALAHGVRREFPLGTVKLLSVTAEDYVEPPDPQAPLPFGSPPSGTLGGGTPRVPVLIDQIAEVA